MPHRQPTFMDETAPDGYPIRPRSFAGSLGFHALIVIFLGLISGAQQERPVNEFVRSHTVLYYDFRQKLPPVAPLQKVGQSPNPQGREKSNRVVVATSPKALSKQQSIFIPVPKIELKDVPTPDLVARTNSAPLPNLPPPPKRAPKMFVPPALRVRPKPTPQMPVVTAAAPLVQVKAPELVTRTPQQLASLPATAPRPRVAAREFVPQPINSTPRLPVPAPVVTAQAPSIDTRTPDLLAKTQNSLDALATAPRPRLVGKEFVPPAANNGRQIPSQVPQVSGAPTGMASTVPGAPTLAGQTSRMNLPLVVPPRAAPTGPANVASDSAIDMVIANLDPARNMGRELPSGARPGDFSKAPAIGPPSSGDAPPGAIRVPNLAIRDGVATSSPKPPAAAAPNGSTRTVVYAEKIRSVPISSLSVALRPQNRFIPAALETRFHGRNVYTIVIPMENMPVYTGDWIVWFAEAEQRPAEMPMVYAPVPSRKMEPIEEAGPANHLKQRVQISGTLAKDGKLSNVALLTRVDAAAQKAVLQDVGEWEFTPAKRNGSAVGVDVVIEIPFDLPTP